jgi:RNA-binding protein 8A
MKGYALVEFESQAEATDAIKNMDGQDLLGQPIGVNWAFVK